MAGSVNKAIIVGNLCADPDVKSFQNGGRIANLRVATNESWKDRATGERKERVEYHSITIAGDGLVGVAERYLRKGSKIYVEGQLRTRKWQDQNGNDRYSTEVVVAGMGGKLVMLDGANSDGQRGGERGEGGGQQRSRSNDRGGQGGGSWADGQRGDREVFNGDRGGWQDNGNGGGDGSSGNSWDDLDDDIPF